MQTMDGKGRVLVIGGGMAGMTAALLLRARGMDVTLLERQERIGKKLLLTGNGRCNISNRWIDASCYVVGGAPGGSGEKPDAPASVAGAGVNPADVADVMEAAMDAPSSMEESAVLADILCAYGVSQMADFLAGLGVALCERQGCLYPVTRQAATVLDAYRYSLRESGVELVCGRRAVQVMPGPRGFSLRCQSDASEAIARNTRRGASRGADGLDKTGAGTPGGQWRPGLYGHVLLACGGHAGVYHEDRWNGDALATALGHHVRKGHPALTAAICVGDYRGVAGVRADASLTLLVDGKPLARERGELQMTAYGLSGIPVFQLSRRMDAVERGTTYLVVDFLPFLEDMALEDTARENGYAALCERARRAPGRSLEEMLSGWLQRKLAAWLCRAASLKASASAGRLGDQELRALYQAMRQLRVRVSALQGYRQAQVSTGGVPLSELTATLESRFVPGVYMAGEMLDVCGACGGYNLHFAYASAARCVEGICGDDHVSA